MFFEAVRVVVLRKNLGWELIPQHTYIAIFIDLIALIFEVELTFLDIHG